MDGHNVTKRGVSRRDFLKRTVVAGIGLTGLSAALEACTVPTTAPAAAPAANQPAAATDAPKAAAPASGEKVKLTWFTRDDAIVNPWEDKMVETFKAANPDIDAEWISGGQGAEREAKFNALVAGGTPPDVFSSWQEAGFGDYAARNLPLDLQPFLDASTDLDLKSVPENILNIYKHNGQLLGIPFASGASYLFYNKNAFDAAGVPYPTTDWTDKNWTWDAWVEMGKKLTKNYGTPDAMYGASDGMWPCNSTHWLFEADLFPQEAYDTGFFTKSPADSAQSIATYQAMNDLIYKHQVSPTPSLGDAMSQVGDPFKTGRIAMILNGVWGFWTYSDITDFEVGAAALPTGSGTAKPVIFTDPWMIARGSKHPQEAWKFVKMLVDPKQGAKSYMDLTGVVPPASELLQGWYDNIGKRMPWLAGDKLKQLIEGSMKQGYESANHLLVGFNEMEAMVDAERQAIFLNKSKPEEVVVTIRTKLEQIAADTQKQVKG
jgi:multiple sugar transport system substrate-binding protein